jgi:positive regulator of sigma E activity
MHSSYAFKLNEPAFAHNWTLLHWFSLRSHDAVMVPLTPETRAKSAGLDYFAPLCFFAFGACRLCNKRKKARERAFLLDCFFNEIASS